MSIGHTLKQRQHSISLSILNSENNNAQKFVSIERIIDFDGISPTTTIFIAATGRVSEFQLRIPHAELTSERTL